MDSCRFNLSRKEGMSNFQSFAKTLENKIREELFAELKLSQDLEKSGEVTDETGYQHLGWLMGQNSNLKTSLKSPCNYERSPYSRYRKPPRPRPSHQFNEAQTQAFLLLKCYASNFAENFNMIELKRSYRQALLKVHPDKGGQAEDFWQVRNAFTLLKSLV